MIVMKFGGTSIADAPSIQRAAKIVKQHVHQHPVVVNSAMGKTTRNLLSCALLAAQGDLEKAEQKLHEICDYHLRVAEALIPELEKKEPGKQLVHYFDELKKLINGLWVLRDLTLRSQDKVLSYGELMSTTITSAALVESQIDSILLDARTLIITDDRFSHAKPVEEIVFENVQKNVRPLVESGKIPVIQGYIGATRQGATTTLGFEGSDLTAALIGAALDASDVQIWKDVPGIMTADPVVFPGAYTVTSITFDEAAELTFFGAKVLHPSSIEPARKKNIPVHVYNSKQPDAEGTELTSSQKPYSNLPKSIAYKKALSLWHVRSNRMQRPFDFLKSVFDLLDRERIIPYIVSTAETHLTMAVSGDIQTEHLLEYLDPIADVQITKHKATVSLVGENLRNEREIAVTVLSCLDGIPVDMIAHGASPINFTFVVNEADVESAVSKLHSYFFKTIDSAIFK